MTPDTRTALKKVRRFARENPLTANRIGVTALIDALFDAALLSTSPGEPEPTEASALRAEIRRWACYCFTRHGHDAHLYNELAKLAGMEPPGADHGIECGFIGDPKQPDIYIELPDSCGDVMSKEDEYGKLD